MSGFASDSEAEDEGSRVTLPDRFIGKGNAKSQQSAMKLTELGPRLTLEIFKVEQGVNEGDVLYHKFVHKTPAEAAKIKAKVSAPTFILNVFNAVVDIKVNSRFLLVAPVQCWFDVLKCSVFYSPVLFCNNISRRLRRASG